MTRRHPLPRIWLMTDPRFGDELLAAIKRLPLGTGVIFRHYELPYAERRALFRQVRRVCRQRGVSLLLAGDERAALRWRADGYHGRTGRGRSPLIHSAPVHDRRELAEALRQSADLLLISPLFATRSHAGACPLGMAAFNALARQAGAAHIIALGGMSKTRAAILNRKLVHGWAAIDAFRNITA